MIPVVNPLLGRNTIDKAIYLRKYQSIDIQTCLSGELLLKNVVKVCVCDVYFFIVGFESDWSSERAFGSAKRYGGYAVVFTGRLDKF